MLLELLSLLQRQQLYHSVLLIKQLPDLVVVFTQAALQADPPGLRLDKREHKSTKGSRQPSHTYHPVRTWFHRRKFCQKKNRSASCSVPWSVYRLGIYMSNEALHCSITELNSSSALFNTLDLCLISFFWVASISGSCQLCILQLGFFKFSPRLIFVGCFQVSLQFCNLFH